ncbi:MAG: hypothetical protein AB1724_02510 [Thermodesulfobacteriota bacterium]
MDCKDIREKIRETVANNGAAENDKALARHIGECELCRQFYTDLILDRQLCRALEEMPVPEPSPDFVARAMRHAVSCNRLKPRRSLAMGAVAALIIAVFVPLMMKSLKLTEPVADVVIPVGGEKTVQIMIQAAAPRTNVTLSIALAGDVALKNFPNQHGLQWQADLDQGDNLLALPLLLKDRAGGDVKVRYQYNGTEKEVRIKVRAETNGPAHT